MNQINKIIIIHWDFVSWQFTHDSSPPTVKKKVEGTVGAVDFEKTVPNIRSHRPTTCPDLTWNNEMYWRIDNSYEA